MYVYIKHSNMYLPCYAARPPVSQSRIVSYPRTREMTIWQSVFPSLMFFVSSLLSLHTIQTHTKARIVKRKKNNKINKSLKVYIYIYVYMYIYVYIEPIKIEE